MKTKGFSMLSQALKNNRIEKETRIGFKPTFDVLANKENHPEPWNPARLVDSAFSLYYLAANLAIV